MRKNYDELANKYNITAREYILVLRLAIYRAYGHYAEKSVDVAQYPKDGKVYALACDILKVLHKED